MSQVLALAAHDLKNALGGLEAELARLAEAPDAAAAHAAHHHCQDLRQQFVHFLTLYGAEQGQLRALCEDESATDLIASLQTRWTARLAAEGSAVAIDVRIAPDCPPFHHFDRRLVYMALDAAVHNAARFAAARMTLHVGASRHGEHQGLRFAVEDDGPGLGHHDGLATATGLGTALCEAVAAAHQLGALRGAVSLQNRPDASGCCFSLWLP
ncbi:MAG: hypothetical protein RI907_2315 [Pseudomonadota bacterium]|jgi:signal transduction histidine kinase